MITYLRELPTGLVSAVEMGEAAVRGNLIKDVASGKILGQLVPTRKLLELAEAGPLALPLAVLKSGSELVTNVQLEQVRQQLSNLQALTALTTVVGIANLAVTTGGFALVLARLKNISRQMEALSEKVERVDRRLLQHELTHVLTALQRCEDAFSWSAGSRTRIWQEEERELQRVVDLMAVRVFEGDLGSLFDPEATSKLLENPEVTSQDLRALLEWPMICAQSRVEALLLLREPEVAALQMQRLADWLGRVSLDEAAIIESRRRGRPLPPSLIEKLLAEVEALRDTVKASEQSTRDRAIACRTYLEAGVDTKELVEAVRSNPEARLMVVLTGEALG